MKLTGNKTTATAIAMLLVLTMTVTLALPAVNAHTPPWDVPTYTFISATNNVIGVNQPFTIVFWTASYPPTANGAYGDRWTFNVEVTKPDNSKETLGPFTSDPVGSGSKAGSTLTAATTPGSWPCGAPGRRPGSRQGRGARVAVKPHSPADRALALLAPRPLRVDVRRTAGTSTQRRSTSGG